MMKKHSAYPIIILAASVLCSLLTYAAVHGGDSRAPSSSENAAGPSSNKMLQAPDSAPKAALSCKYYIEKDFMASVAAENSDPAVNIKSGRIASGTGGIMGNIMGGIVPHHLLAGKMIASFFKTLSESSPETLIIVAPNHRRIGHNSLNTSLLDWNTPFGILENDSSATNRFISGMDASQDNTLMEEEHSISSLVPYIRYYMPKVKIVPLLLHGNYTANESANLGKQLSETSSGEPGTIVVASVDFSHYLDADTADQMDKRTLSAIKAFDLKEISLMGNDNLDSPPSVISLLRAMSDAGANIVEVTGHDNSSDITGKGADYTTSYYTMFFKRPAGKAP